MKKANILVLINEAQEKLKALGLKTRFLVSDPQSEEKILKVEKKLKINFPPDYRNFIIQHGLLSIHLGGAQTAGQQMLSIDSIVDATLDLREDLRDSDLVPKKAMPGLIPFQYILDESSIEYYVFRWIPNSTESDVIDLDEDWDKLSDSEYKYAKNFTEHIAQFVADTLQEAETYEK